ncbi:hypothetical protein FSI96_021095 [Escherichia coli]|nr:hypothetical protein [Escherichia coli]
MFTRTRGNPLQFVIYLTDPPSFISCLINTRYRQEQQLRIDGKSKALVGSEDLPVLNENTFNSHAPAPSSR